MTVQSPVVELYYPESDGQPMAETDLHRDWMFRIIDVLQYRYDGEPVYISGNLFLYYHDGDPQRSVSPDALVVKGIPAGMRRIYKVWEEGKVPDVVFETTSESTRRNDTVRKFELYARIGIREYFLYDPTADYLNPPLQGYRLGSNGYVRIEPDTERRLTCEELDLFLELRDGALVFRDRQTGRIQLTRAEAIAEDRDRQATARRTAEVARRAAEAAQRSADAARLNAEAELDRELAARIAAEAHGVQLAAEIAALRAQLAEKASEPNAGQ